jgi:hypothetical protein
MVFAKTLGIVAGVIAIVIFVFDLIAIGTGQFSLESC